MANEYDKILDDMMAKCEALRSRHGEAPSARAEPSSPQAMPYPALWSGLCLLGQLNLLVWVAWSSAWLPGRRP